MRNAKCGKYKKSKRLKNAEIKKYNNVEYKYKENIVLKTRHLKNKNHCHS